MARVLLHARYVDWSTWSARRTARRRARARSSAGPDPDLWIDFRHPSFGSDAIDPDLNPMQMQEATVGIEHQLTNDLAASVRYVHKQIDRAIEDIGALDARATRST